MQFREGGNIWGTHRALSPLGCLPQSATKLNTELPLFSNELLVSVSNLQIDASSFKSLKDQSVNDQDLIKKIKSIIQEKGKMHNPITNSGGVFLGKIACMGPQYPQAELQVGDSVVSLVSLTLTPLEITAITSIDPKRDRLHVEGHAIVFASGIVAPLPPDFSNGITLAALDVCGAPAQVKRMIKTKDTVFVIGLGKAGKAVATQAQLSGALVLGIDTDTEAVKWCQQNLDGIFEVFNAQKPLEVYAWIHQHTQGHLADLTVLTTNIADTEMAAILACKNQGTVLFFGMQTSFQKATLGAEGVTKDVQLVMGNGFVPGHAELMINLLREHAPLRKWFEEKFG